MALVVKVEGKKTVHEVQYMLSSLQLLESQELTQSFTNYKAGTLLLQHN